MISFAGMHFPNNIGASLRIIFERHESGEESEFQILYGYWLIVMDDDTFLVLNHLIMLFFPLMNVTKLPSGVTRSSITML